MFLNIIRFIQMRVLLFFLKWYDIIKEIIN